MTRFMAAFKELFPAGGIPKPAKKEGTRETAKESGA
jgi:hypothetical protein